MYGLKKIKSASSIPTFFHNEECVTRGLKIITSHNSLGNAVFIPYVFTISSDLPLFSIEVTEKGLGHRM